MNVKVFKESMQKIYGAHGRLIPNEVVLLLLWERLEKLEDSFMKFAVSELTNCEKLPANLGLELSRVLYPQWLALRHRAKEKYLCPDCDSQMPGFFYAWIWENNRLKSFIFRCPCNSFPDFSNLSAISKKEAEANNYICIPSKYQGGVATFEYELLRFGPLNENTELFKKENKDSQEKGFSKEEFSQKTEASGSALCLEKSSEQEGLLKLQADEKEFFLVEGDQEIRDDLPEKSKIISTISRDFECIKADNERADNEKQDNERQEDDYERDNYNFMPLSFKSSASSFGQT